MCSLSAYIFILFRYELCFSFFFSSRRRHTRCALVTGVQTCALPISARAKLSVNTFELVDASGQAGRGDALGCCFWRRSCLMLGKHKGDAAPEGDAGGDCESP